MLEGYERMLHKQNYSTQDEVFQANDAKFHSKGSSHSQFNGNKSSGQLKWTLK